MLGTRSKWHPFLSFLYLYPLLSAISEEEDDDYYRRNDRETVRDTYGDAVNVEVFREKTIEDMIDEQRAKLAAEGKVRDGKGKIVPLIDQKGEREDRQIGRDRTGRDGRVH